MKITWWKTWKNLENFTIFCRRILSWWVGLEREVYQGICVAAPVHQQETTSSRFSDKWVLRLARNMLKKGVDGTFVCVLIHIFEWGVDSHLKENDNF